LAWVNKQTNPATNIYFSLLSIIKHGDEGELLQIEKNRFDGLLLHFTILYSDMEEETPESNIWDVFKQPFWSLTAKIWPKQQGF